MAPSAISELPPDLARLLGTARDLELAAETHQQQLRAIRWTATVMLACAEAGWRTSEIAAVLALDHPAARARIRAARRRGNRLHGVKVPEPLRPVRPLARILTTPVEDREWLRIDEAAEFARVSRATLRVWRRAGMLPNTSWLTSKYPVFLRADLLRVLRAPRRGSVGVDRQAVLAAIERSGV